MNAVRILLMMLMCLVTDAPGPVTHGVFEHVEDAEEIHASRRRKAARLASATPPALQVTTVVLTNPMPTLRPQSAARPVAHHSARKIPPAAREPAAASDDH